MDFKTACSTGNLHRVQQLLLNPSINPQYANNEPLELAMKNGHKDIVNLLLKDHRVINDKENLMRICVKHICNTNFEELSSSHSVPFVSF
jgi:ankyrin repeat protein